MITGLILRSPLQIQGCGNAPFALMKMIRVIYPVSYAAYFVICRYISIIAVKLKLEVYNNVLHYILLL